jgi:hypothetical protein
VVNTAVIDKRLKMAHRVGSSGEEAASGAVALRHGCGEAAMMYLCCAGYGMMDDAVNCTHHLLDHKYRWLNYVAWDVLERAVEAASFSARIINAVSVIHTAKPSANEML